MPNCHALVDSKLYKCSWFVSLPIILKLNNQLDDAEWKPYLEYVPLDLSNPTNSTLQEFSDTQLTSIPLCDMCSNNPNNSVIKIKEHVLP
jgi:hypothetical protein